MNFPVVKTLFNPWSPFWPALALTFAVSRMLAPERRKGLAAAAGLFFMAFYFSPAMAAALSGLSLALWALTAGDPIPEVCHFRVACALAICGLLAICYSGIFLQYRNGFALDDGLKIMFLAIFIKKVIYYLYERKTARVRHHTIGEVLAYFFSLPFMSGIGVSVAPSHMQSRWDRLGMRESLGSGAATLGKAGLYALAYAALDRWAGCFILGPVFMKDWRGRPWWHLWVAFAVTYLAFYLVRYACEQTCIGSARLLGWDLRDNYEAPLLAPDYAEHWRRWNVHTRDMLMALFYYPTALALARRRPDQAVGNLMTSFLVTFAGSGLFNFLIRAILYPPLAWSSYGGLAFRVIIHEISQWVFVCIASISILRRRAAGRPEPDFAVRATGAAVVLFLRGLTLPLLMHNYPPDDWSTPLKIAAASFGVYWR